MSELCDVGVERIFLKRKIPVSFFISMALAACLGGTCQQHLIPVVTLLTRFLDRRLVKVCLFFNARCICSRFTTIK